MFESGDLCGEPLRQQRRGRTDQSGRMYKEHITCGEVGKKVSTVVTPWSTHSYLPPPGGATGGGGGALRSSSSSWLWGRVLCWPLLPLCSELLFLFLLPPLDMATACRLFLPPPPLPFRPTSISSLHTSLVLSCSSKFTDVSPTLHITTCFESFYFQDIDIFESMRV